MHPSVRLSIRLSLCHTVTPWHCIRTVQAKIPKSSVWVSMRTLVYRDKILCPWVRCFPLNEGVKEVYPLKDVSLPILAHIQGGQKTCHFTFVHIFAKH